MLSYGTLLIAYHLWVRTILNPLSALMAAELQASNIMGEAMQSFLC
jgi:hypothetical protein